MLTEIPLRGDIGGYVGFNQIDWRHAELFPCFASQADSHSMILKNPDMKLLFFGDIKGTSVGISELANFVTDFF